MAEFYLTLSNIEIASQIAILLNAYNKLTLQHTSTSILTSQARYFIECSGNLITGCVGLTYVSPEVSKIHHLSVRPEFRKQGIARRLITTVISNCTTKHVFMTIRDDNVPSLYLAYNLGFSPINRIWHKDHYVILVGRSTE